ncbi:MAG TPA: DoxX family protein [Chitinophaga sp.]|uniref:DoxX family protein n=1 Tax=Chitinophaga sp. TaxID=1869181 RepID=UPI002CDD57E5|nr:DoxX family protein [Chitinophaga sp.]HVI47887.1 DoxX family protein [Chitinophaga sp.]
MNTLLWTLQAFLAATFLYSGIMKSTQQREKLMSVGQTGVANLTYPEIRLIGITEILGAVGIIVPWAIRVLPVLTPVASLCFAIIMIFAVRIHYRRKEFASVTFNIVLFCMGVFVAYMRFAALSL